MNEGILCLHFSVSFKYAQTIILDISDGEIMALPTVQLITTLFLAHLVIFFILLCCWWFIRHAQRKHHEQMAHHRIRAMPKAEHPELKNKVLERPKPASIVLPSREEAREQIMPRRKVVKELVKPKAYEKEWAQVESELRVLRGGMAPTFHNATPGPQELSKEEKISSHETKLDEVIQSTKNRHQEEFEKHFIWVTEAIQRKGYKDPGQVTYEAQLDSIDEALAKLKVEDDSKDTGSRAQQSSYMSNTSHSHQDWRDDLAQDFEELYLLLSQGERKRKASIFSLNRKQDRLHLKEHKEETEKKAIELVRNIARRIEGDHPIPVAEIDWIEASLRDVHKDIWKQHQEKAPALLAASSRSSK